MKRMKLWAGIGASILVQTSTVAIDTSGLDISFGSSPAIARDGEMGGAG